MNQPDATPPLAFLYDRCATDRQAILRVRLDHCRARAALLGYEVAGEWTDDGMAALTHDDRSAFDAMCAAMACYAGTRRVVCIVDDWDRISRDGIANAAMRRRVALAGGHCETAGGETDEDQDHSSGKFTARVVERTP